MPRSLLLLSLLSAPALAHAGGPPGSLALTHATVIDGTGAPAKPDMALVITGDRISALGPTTSVRVPPGARVIDATGKFVIPGLWDMHGHLTYAKQPALALMVMNGVTGVRDLGGNLAVIDRWRDEIARGVRLGPHIIRAGPFVDGPKPNAPDRLTVTNAAEARAAVDSLKKLGVDCIKVHNELTPDAFFALTDEARRQGLPVAVHMPSGLWEKKTGGITIAEASDAGARSLEHIETLFESALYRKDAPAKTIDEAFAEYNGPAGAALYARLVKNGTWFDPTLVAYYRGFVFWTSKDPQSLGRRMAVHLKHIELVRAMHRAGVQIMTGTDFSDWALIPGADLHDELALLVQAGFTPMEALQAATLKPAVFLGSQDSLGTVEKGKIADLVVLYADPLEDINQTRMIDSVVLGGRLIPVAALQESFAKPEVVVGN
jgi:imidazolonepropionase-like amidohydrolase